MTAAHRWAFVLVAAGAGSRIGGAPKQFRRLGALPLWRWSAETAAALCGQGGIEELIVVFPAQVSGGEIPGLRDFPRPLKCVQGGATRTESVRNGLAATDADYVLIHDAARPFLSEETCFALMQGTGPDRGCVPLLASVDSLKRVKGDSIAAISRDSIYRTQTPQAFPRKPLLELLSRPDVTATDEATVWLEAGKNLDYIPGDEKNFKITTAFDWMTAQALVEASREIRTGIGYDVHELVPGRRLVLGGVDVESPLGLLGHSDADAVCHTVMDALLGAAGEGDIGTLYPATDETYRDADSMELLADVLRRLQEKRWNIAWIDLVLMAQTPRLASKIPEIRNNLIKVFTAIGFDAKINLKVKSGEFVGSIGRGECVTCFATATLERFWKGSV